MTPIVNIYRLGRAPYIKTLNIQNVLFDNLKRIVTSNGYDNAKVIDNIRQRDATKAMIKSMLESHLDTRLTSSSELSNVPVTNSLILVEHEPVYTVGLRARQYDQDYVAKLKARLDANNLKADFVQTNRGGLITFHGPGQLVVYPILYLGDFARTVPNKSVKTYVKRLEDTIIDTLSNVGIKGAHTVREYPGVWLAGGERKIAFVGITCKRYVTMHGISINCDCDLSWFDHITSCGIEDKLITSAQRESNQFEYGSPAHDVDPGGRSSLNHDERSDSSRNNPILSDTQQPAVRPIEHSGSNYGVQNIAEAFCSSFSRHFDCELLEE